MKKSIPVSNVKTLETIVRWGIYATALVPLIIFKDFFSPFHFGKVVVFRTLIEIIAIFYLALILADRSFLPKRTKLFWSVTIFTAAFGATSITSVYPYQSFMGTLERMGGWFTFIHFWLMFVMMSGVLRTKEQWLTLLKISVLASVLSTIYGFLQKTNASWIVGSGGRARIFGTLGNTALFAGYTIVNTFFALILALRSKEMTRYLYGAVFVMNFIAIFMTAVRGSLLGMIVALAVFALLSILAGANRGLKISFLSLVVIIVLLEGILVAGKNSDFVKKSGYLSRLSDISFNARTVQTRFWAWQAGLDGWNDSAKTIFLGWGPENFNVPFAKHFNPKFFIGPSSETLFDRAHNMFIEILVTMGLVGFFSYIGMFVVMVLMLWKMYRANDKEQRITSIVLLSGLVAYVIHNSFIFDTSANFIVFFIFAGFLNFINLPHDSLPANKTKYAPVSLTLRYSAILVAVILASISIYRTNILPARANYAATRAVVASWRGDHVAALEGFERALSFNVFPSYELRHRYAQYVLENYGKFGAKGIDPGKTLLASIEQVKKNLASPLDYLPYLYISRSYIILGKDNPKSPFNDLALQSGLKALEISPTFVRTYYEVAQAYINKGDSQKAIETFRKAADLNPEVELSWWYMGLTQVGAGDIANGMESLQKAIKLGHNPSENELIKLAGILAQLKRFDGVAQILEKLTAAIPANPDYASQLATAYAEVGNITGAVKEAKRAAALDASFENEARAFVQRIGGKW